MKKLIGFLMLAFISVSPVCFGDAQGEETTKPRQLVLGTSGTTVSNLMFAFDAVANGQTSKATTITGVTTSSRCVATLAEVATNSISVRAAVPTTNTVTVTVSGDPGASNADYTVICIS